MTDFLFRGPLADLDPDLHELIQIETERQHRKIILIASESSAPAAVREALGSSFQNLYAEGYPDDETRRMTEADILDYPARLSYYRRYSDPRYYKGVEYADAVEALARRRCAELFAANGVSADNIYVNVQPLSGAPANNAVYSALLSPGDAILGLNLLHGGHLSHGSPVNRSGKLYRAVHYTVAPDSERIDYDEVARLAKAEMPKIIIAGYSSYPWVPDWARYREIADSVGAILLADISHIAGLVAAQVIPSPVGYAQVITFTTHKTLCGPRGACIITTDPALSKKIDRGVFPGEQGGPHIHNIAAMAISFKLSRSAQFRELQAQILKNCAALTNRLRERGFRIPFGGSNTHLVNFDCKSIHGPDGATLSGDIAARILDNAGLVTKRNTIPGDKTAGDASGIRMGTTWATQRGMKEAEMGQIADAIADILQATTPYMVESRRGPALRAKVDYQVFADAQRRIRQLADAAGSDGEITRHGYPHFQTDADAGAAALDLLGENARLFVNYAFASDADGLQPGQSQATQLHTPLGVIAGVLTLRAPNHYQFSSGAAGVSQAADWLRALSDGFVHFDADVLRRLPGPIRVEESAGPAAAASADAAVVEAAPKPYYIGITAQAAAELPEFTWSDGEETLKRTVLNQTHRQMGAKMVPFAGWDMPVWYTSVVEEHLATRQAAGLFDVSHMGVFQAEGPSACIFLDSVCANDIASLAVGESCYTHFLDPHARVIDDTLVYRRGVETYLVVVNASNDAKDWAWLNAVRAGSVRIDLAHPAAKAFGRGVVLRNLRDPREGAAQRVDIALQGPRSREILLLLGCDAPTRKKITALKRTELCEAVVGGFELVVSRTGYTGEKMAFELFVHPEKAAALWNALLAAGTPLGLKACGLGARDSLRTEAGLPLYGHEMAGEAGLGVAEAGFGAYVKVYKPWFIGRQAYIEKEKSRKGIVVRFRFTEKGVRMAHSGDPVLDKKGKVVGKVTSCAVDREGYLTGQAFVEIKSAEEGTPVWIYQGAPASTGKAPSMLSMGDRTTLPTEAVVLTRFPKQ